MNQLCYDVVVLGAGVAGATCARLAQQRGLHVVLVDPVDPGRPTPARPEWITRPALSILDEMGVASTAFASEPISGAVFHNADLERTAEASEKEPPAFRVDYGELNRSLVEQAVGAGARAVFGVAPGKVQVRERATLVQFPNGETIQGRFLVVASGCGTPPDAGDRCQGRWLAAYQGRTAKDGGDDRLHWALGRHGIVWWQTSEQLVVTLCAPGSREHVAALLQDFLVEGGEARVLPATVGDALIITRPAPAVSALEMDSLVDKGTLRIGDAGGFVCFASLEGIYPAMWSAKLAVDVLAQAVRSAQPQDTLQDFDRLWRTAMAEYLRPPDIETPFLLPLVFSNRQMAARLAAAFWRGQRTE
ncbi:MAG TPA: NAD(P)/FAD-dependent oxidoreductase [Phycisphaerae bacterium]|nr:NAD(P)/FAD-dependent oxidoreductase [Phycisphaerae bacterium]HRY68953.1 NAD(P)/FAD-dependent oxidoreductase [Phycisphaerae bacterium]HSA25780.1 NAD(P)/FAD-dependent oxidoreductase [Phycisphaerae bacterium]